MSAVVTLDAVVKRYATLEALKGVSLQVEEGEILGLLGHNGAGKTTTMKLILGVIAASEGQVTLFGHSPLGHKADELRRALGYLPENVRFYEQLSGREVLDYFARLKGVKCAANAELLERVGIGHAAGRRVKTYSKGMRQRLGLAQALLGAPRLLLLDEPTAGLDPTATAEFYAMLDELRRGGTSILISSHILPGIERHVDRVAILGGGRLLDIGTQAELSRRAALPLTFQVRGEFSGVDWPARLIEHAVTIDHLNAQRLQFSGAVSSKIALLRLLLQESGVTDVEVTEPGLDELYAHYHNANHQAVLS